MARPVVEKGMLIFRGATASFNKVENYLKGRKWEIESLHEVRFVLDHVTMAKSLPKYALVCLDHPEKQSKILPSLLAQKFDIRVIGYFEREGVNLSAQADKMGVAYVLLPPVSGPAVERIINKIRLDEERAAQNQQKASRKKGAAAAGGGDDVIQIRERKKESENPLANAKPESIKFKEAEPEVNPDGTPKKSSLIFMERNVGKEKSTTQEAPVPSESNLWNEDFAPPPERPAPEAVAAAAAAVAEKVAEEERLKRESALEAFDIFHETDAEKSKNAPKEAEAAGGPRSNAFDPNSPRGAPKTANFPFAPVLAPAPVEAKKAVDPLDVFNDSEPAPASSAYQPAVEPNSSPDEGASPEERARALAKLRAAMGKAAKNSDPGNPATTDEDAGKDAGKAGAATAENAAADDLAAPLVDLAKDFAGESEAAREARANREAAEAAKETAQQRDRALAKLRAKIAKPSDRAADESDDVDAEREAGESAAKKKREETEKKSRGESAQETFERAAALAEAQAEQTAAEDRARAEEKALTEK